MSAIWGAVKVTVNVIGWIFLLMFGLCMAGVIAVALTDWYRRHRHRRRDQAAQASTLRARQERQFRYGRPMGTGHPEWGAAMSRQEQERLTEIENNLSSGGKP